MESFIKTILPTTENSSYISHVSNNVVIFVE